MKQQHGQFGAFDGLDNRKEVMALLGRLGVGLTDELANCRRAGVLQGLLQVSTSQFSGKPMVIEPCNTVEAYNLFVAITGVLGVNIEWAAEVIRKSVQYFESAALAAPKPPRQWFQEVGSSV